MKVFISSVVRNFEKYRAAAKDAVEVLDMKPIMSESFGARAYSSEQACLTEVDQCDVYLLILGAGYGYEPEPGISVTQQEFRRAVSSRKPILVFTQKTDFEEKQGKFVKEVSDYKLGFFRASFSEPQELTKLIIQGLNRMDRANSAISEEDFHQRLTSAISVHSHMRQSYAPQLQFSFLPQPINQHAVHDASKTHDAMFQRFHTLGLATIKQGYDDWDDRMFTGIKSGSTAWRVYDDGLTIIDVDAGVKPGASAGALYYVSPTQLLRQALSCFEAVDFKSGWYRMSLKNLDMALFEEPPAVAPSSYSMHLMREKQLTESRLLIPVTRDIAAQWVQQSIERMARRLSY